MSTKLRIMVILRLNLVNVAFSDKRCEITMTSRTWRLVSSLSLRCPDRVCDREAPQSFTKEEKGVSAAEKSSVHQRRERKQLSYVERLKGIFTQWYLKASTLLSGDLCWNFAIEMAAHPEFLKQASSSLNDFLFVIDKNAIWHRKILMKK